MSSDKKYFSHVNINNTQYDVKDAEARTNLDNKLNKDQYVGANVQYLNGMTAVNKAVLTTMQPNTYGSNSTYNPTPINSGQSHWSTGANSNMEIYCVFDEPKNINTVALTFTSTVTYGKPKVTIYGGNSVADIQNKTYIITTKDVTGDGLLNITFDQVKYQYLMVRIVLANWIDCRAISVSNAQDGILSSSDYNILMAKQNAITDLATIRANANTGAGLKTQVKENTQKITNIETSRRPNVIYQGNTTINGSQVSGFSKTDYLMFPLTDISRGNPFDFYFSFTTDNDVTTQQNILDSHFGLALAIQNGKGIMALSSNGTGWDIGTATGTVNILPKTTYYVKYAWTGTAYQTSISTTESSYTPDMTLASNKSPFKTTTYIGGSPDLFGADSSHPFKGIINFAHAVVHVGSETVWQGMADVGFANTSLSNLNDEGNARIDAKQDKQHFIITEDMFDLELDATKGTPPYNASYGYTNITIHEDAGVEWKEGAMYTFVIDTKVSTSANRNVRIRIGEEGDWKPIMVNSSIASGYSVFVKAINNIFFYKTTYQENGALHCFYDTNTTYTINYSIDAGQKTAGVGTYAVDRYALIMQKPDMTWEKITATNAKYSTGTTKKVNTNGFLLNQIRYWGYTTTYATGELMNAAYMYSKSAIINASYSFNCGTAPNWAIGDNIYIVGTVGADGLFYLDATQWWANELPTQADGKIYILIGNALTDTDSTCSFLEERPILYHDGTAIREYTSSKAQALNALGITEEQWEQIKALIG